MTEKTQPPWPAYTVEKWPIEQLKRNLRNSKIHPKAQIEQLRALMREFGWTQPVLAREDGTLIAGHGRLEAGLLEGYKEAPVIVARGWSDAQCRLYAIADNRVSERGKWDREILNLELGELTNLGFDLTPIGFAVSALPGGVTDTEPKLSTLRYQIIVECDDEMQQGTLLQKFEGEGLKAKPMIS